MSKCIYLKQKLNRTIYCKKKRKSITINDCKFCKYKEYKKNKSKDYKPIKKRTYKQYKRERERFSIIYQDLTKCCVPGCLTPFYQVEKNEVFEGAYRSRSVEFGAVCPFCKNHHTLFHNNIEFNLKYKLLFQQAFVDKYSLNWFIKIFGQDYIVKCNKIA